GFAGLHEVVFQLEQAQSHSNPGLEFLRVEWLSQIIVGSGFEPFHHTFLGVFSRQQKNVGVRFGPQVPKRAADIDPVLAGHHPIQQGHARGIRSFQLFPGEVAIFGRNNVVSPLAEQGLKHAPRYRLVIGNEYLHFVTPWQSSARAGSRSFMARSTSTRLFFADSASLFFASISSCKAAAAVAFADRLLTAPLRECADRSSTVMS